jgi:uncharacterized protein YjbJ (UPF0337 family)
MLGTIKTTAGKLTGDVKMQVDGNAEQVAGCVQNVAGGVKDALKGLGAAPVHAHHHHHHRHPVARRCRTDLAAQRKLGLIPSNGLGLLLVVVVVVLMLVG